MVPPCIDGSFHAPQRQDHVGLAGYLDMGRGPWASLAAKTQPELSGGPRHRLRLSKAAREPRSLPEPPGARSAAGKAAPGGRPRAAASLQDPRGSPGAEVLQRSVQRPAGTPVLRVKLCLRRPLPAARNFLGLQLGPVCCHA